MALKSILKIENVVVLIVRQFMIFKNTFIPLRVDTNFRRIVGLYATKQADVLRRITLNSRKPLLLLWTVPFLSSREEAEEDPRQLRTKLIRQKKDIISAIHKADSLFESNKYEDAISVLMQFKSSKDVEVLWRLGRAQYNLAQSAAVPEADKKRLIHEAYDEVAEALELDDNHWAAHKWMSVLLDACSAYEGIKARVSQLERVKGHMLRAAELNPKDATTLYMIGSWCFQIADMPWLQRKIAATIFAAPPTSSFEEALVYFSKAEEIDPKFYSKNLLMMGKTLLKLQKVEEATAYLVQARDFVSTCEEDDLVKKEASDILRTVKVDSLQ